MIGFKQRGNFDKTEVFLKKSKEQIFLESLDKHAKRGVAVLSSVTPIRTGVTANSWNYEIRRGKDTTTIYWTNSNTVNGIPLVILLEYGHATRNGGYVKGREFINPTIQPLFDQITNDIWKEVTNYG